MLKKFGIIILTIIVIFLIIYGISYIQIILDKVQAPERYDAPDNKSHINGEGFYPFYKTWQDGSSRLVVQLNDGRIFLAGGAGSEQGQPFVNDLGKTVTLYGSKNTEIFDLKTGKSVPGPKLNFPRNSDSDIYLLPDGRVFIYGQEGKRIPFEIYDPKTNTIKKFQVKLPVDPDDIEVTHNSLFIDVLNKDEIIFGLNNCWNFGIFNFRTDKFRFVPVEFWNLPFIYAGRTDDVLYFMGYKKIYKVFPDEARKFPYEVIDQPRSDTIYLKYGKILPDKKHILMFGEDSSAIFDIKNETFTFYDDCGYTKNDGYVSELKELMLGKYILSLQDNHMLILRPDVYENYNMIEYYVENGKLIREIKDYVVEYFQNNRVYIGNILYIGNDQFLYIRNGETYIWKKKGA